MFAERIKEVQGLTVITPNLFIARLFRGSRVRVIVLGGLYQEESESLVGPSVLDAIGSIGFSKAFIGISGFTIAGGFMRTTSGFSSWARWTAIMPSPASPTTLQFIWVSKSFLRPSRISL